jgi:hypothetical protein
MIVTKWQLWVEQAVINDLNLDVKEFFSRPFPYPTNFLRN